MAIPPGQNPFILTQRHHPAHGSPLSQSREPTSRHGLPPAQAPPMPPAPNRQPVQGPSVHSAQRPSQNQCQQPGGQGRLRSTTNDERRWGTWGNPIGDSGGRLPWRNMKPGDPMPKIPTFSECVGRMDPNHRYPNPPPQPPRPGPSRSGKKNRLRDAEGMSRNEAGLQDQDSGWRPNGQTNQSRGQWTSRGPGQILGSGGGGHSRRRSGSMSSYERDLRMEGSWGNKKSSCVIM